MPDLAWILGGTAVWAASAAGVAMVLGGVIGRSHPGGVPDPDPEPAFVPLQRSHPTSTGPRSGPHLPCAYVGRATRSG